MTECGNVTEKGGKLASAIVPKFFSQSGIPQTDPESASRLSWSQHELDVWDPTQSLADSSLQRHLVLELVIAGQTSSWLSGPTVSHAAEAGVRRSPGRWRTTLIHLALASWARDCRSCPAPHVEAFRGKSVPTDL